jgi:hypothetical protein
MNHPTVHRLLYRPLPIAPLVTFRILFGGLMMIGALRFMQKGWVERLYGEPVFFFKYYGFEWVKTLDVSGMYAVYSLIALSAAGIMLGFVYRWSVLLFFISFSYAELTDATNYLNHYYLVILLAFLLFFLPANRRFSLDTTWRRPSLSLTHVPAWTIHLLQFQVGVVYFFAGFAKLNPDWLFRAMPLAVWLPEKAGIPVIGPLLTLPAAAFAFSWFGAMYDLTIPFWLFIKKTRPWAYGAVVVFHALTKMLFNIGLFPFIMIFNTLIFFPAKTHHRWLKYLGYHPGEPGIKEPTTDNRQPITPLALALYIALQVIIPLRFLCYSGNVLWTEEGYRFAWRVMLVEKNGYATFYVSDAATGRRTEVINSRFLTPFQEKQMAIQPDFILQYAHFLARHYREREGFQQPVVTVDSYVALNGRPGERFIDPGVNLADVHDGLGTKKWVLMY